MPLIHRAVAAIAALSSLAFAAPIAISLESRQSSDSACVNGLKRVYGPELFNIYYYPGVEPFPSKSSVINIFNEGKSGGSAQDQVAKWSNLPANVENCTVGYSQEADRSFSVFDNGLIQFSQLTGVPDVVTSATVPAFEAAGAARGSLDFTFWPQVQGAATHVGGPVNCGAEVVLKLFKDMSVNGGAGSITLEQNNKNGFWLEHSC